MINVKYLIITRIFNFILRSGCFTHTFPLPSERFSPTIASVDNYVIFMGGRLASSREVLSDSIDILDTTRSTPDRWTTLRMYSVRVRALIATIGRTLIRIGGINSANDPVQDVELLDLRTTPPKLSVIGTIDYSRIIRSDHNNLAVIGDELVISLSDGLLSYNYVTNTTTYLPFSFPTDIRSAPVLSIDGTANIIVDGAIIRYRNQSMTNIPFAEAILGPIINAFHILGRLFVITNDRMLLFDVNSGALLGVHQVSNLVNYALAHDNKIFMFTGPSRGVINTVTIYQPEKFTKFSLPYTRYNFAAQEFAATANGDNLYVVGWTFNSPVASTQVLVYDIANSRHQFAPFPYDNLEAVHEQNDNLFMILQDSSLGRDLVVFNLESRSNITMQLPLSYEYTSAYSVEGNNKIYFHGTTRNGDPITSCIDIVTVFNTENRQFHHVCVPDGEKINKIFSVGTKLFVDRQSTAAVLVHLDILDTVTEQWSYHNISSPQLTFFMLKAGNKLVVFPDHFGTLTQFDVYDSRRDRWSVVQVSTPRTFASSEIVDDVLYIAGGSANDQFLDSVEVYDLNTLARLNEMQLQEPRRLIVTEALHPYVVFAGGEKIDGSLSGRIEIYNTVTGAWHRSASFPLPELIGLNFGMSLVGTRIFFRYNNYVIILDLSNDRIDPLMIPFMSGYGSHVVGSNIIFYGQYGRLAVYFFYEVNTGSVFQITTPHIYDGQYTLLWRNNFVFFMSGVAVVPVPYVLNTMSNQQVFMNQAVTFAVNATGNFLRYNWRLNDRPLNVTTPTLVIPQEQLQDGTYTVQITDHCQATTSQSASLVVYPAPSFARKFSQVIALCKAVARFNVAPQGQQVQVKWLMNDEWLPYVGTEVEINMAHLSCGSTHRLCALATNPSGNATTCGELKLLDITRVFDGPRPTINNPFLEVGSKITLQMDILYGNCKNHTWNQDGTVVETSADMSSTYEIEVGRTAQTGSKIFVVAICGESLLASDIYIVPAKTIPVWAFIVLMIGGVGIVVAAIVLGIISYNKLKRSKEQELELKTMLSQAHQETIAQRLSKGTQLISCVNWEWKPDDTFSFTPIENFPARIDTSHFLGKKSDLLEVDVWTQGVLEISSKKLKKRARISSFLNQRLLDEAPNVTIYAPQSPKFEVKVHPETFNLDDGTDVTVTVSARLRITTKVKIKLLIVLQNQHVYSSIDFTLASLPSPWLDLEDIQMSDQFLGSGG